MAGRSAQHVPEMPTSRRRTPETPHLPTSSTAHHRVAGNDKGKTVLTKRMTSASPLRTVDTNRMSPALNRPLLSKTASIASGTSSLPATPLDDIPRNLWPRVLRSATTPETSTPELSIDEITSTRLSLDDQAILTSLPRGSDRKEAQTRRLLMRTAFGNMWGENNGRFKKMTKRLRNIPSGLFTRKDRRSREVSTPATIDAFPTSDSMLPQLELTTELYIPDTSASSHSANSADSKPAILMDYECKPKGSESCQEEMAKISTLIRKDLYETRNRDLILPFSRSAIAEPLPRHFLGVPTFNNTSSTLAPHLARNAEDRLLHGPRSLKAISRQRVGRVASVTSVEELRTHAFGSRRANRPSLSGFSFKHTSAPSISRTSYSTCRPATHSGSVSSVSATLVSQKPRLFMDGSKVSTQPLWRVSDPQSRPSMSSTIRPVSKDTASRNSLENHPTVSTGCMPVADIGAGFGDLPEYNKIPICVPRRVEPPRRLRYAENEGETFENDQWLGLHPQMTVATSPVSDSSFGSLSVRGHWSIRSYLERKVTEREQARAAEPHSPVGSRTKALYAALFQGSRHSS